VAELKLVNLPEYVSPEMRFHGFTAVAELKLGRETR